MTASASADLTLEEQTAEGDTPLTLAAAAGLVDNVRVLLAHGASPHSTNGSNESPLLIGTNHPRLTEQVPRSRGPSGETPPGVMRVPHPQVHTRDVSKEHAYPFTSRIRLVLILRTHSVLGE